MQRLVIGPVQTEQDVRDYFAQLLADEPHFHSAENLVAYVEAVAGIGDVPDRAAFLAVVDAIARALAPSEGGICEELERDRAERYTEEQMEAMLTRAYGDVNNGGSTRSDEIDGVRHVPPYEGDLPEPGPTWIELMKARWAAFERR